MVNTRTIALAAALALIAAAGAWAAFSRYSTPEGWAERTVMPWGIMVPSYAFFASSAAGVAILASALLLARGAAAAESAKKAYTLSLALLVPAWFIVLVDLGRPDHAQWILAGFNPTSRIAWMPVFYGLLALPVLALLIILARGGDTGPLAKTLAVAALLGGIGLEMNLGQVFGSAVAVPGLADARLGLQYAVAAVALGGGWLVLYSLASRGGLGGDYLRAALAGIAVASVVTGMVFAWYAAYSSVSPGVAATLEEMMRGSHAALLYLEIALGYVAAPLLALYALRSRSAAAAALAGLLVLAAGFSEKYSLVTAAEEARLRHPVYGETVNPYQLLYSSVETGTPTSEALVVASAFALAGLAFIVLDLFVALISRKPHVGVAKVAPRR